MWYLWYNKVHSGKQFGNPEKANADPGANAVDFTLISENQKTGMAFPEACGG